MHQGAELKKNIDATNDLVSNNLIPPYSVWVIRMYIHIMNIQKDN